MTYNELLDMGFEEFSTKLASIPESEPLFHIIKSRSIKLEEIKDKEERKYWAKQKELNKIPSIYITTQEIEQEMNNKLKNGGMNKWKQN